MEISDAHFHHLNHHQAMAGHPLEEALGCPRSQQQQQQQQQQDQKKARPQPEQSLKCPRCDSTNTKFCYYNNYSLSQPRYFCKGCRRYWTQGGSLRNVPVGGGCRKNKRSSNSNSNSNSNSSNSSAKVKSQDNQELITANTNNPILPSIPLPPLSYDPCSDLTLAFANDSTFLLSNPNPNPSPNPSSSSNHGGFLDILRGGFVDPAALCYAGFGSGKEVEGGGGGDQQPAAGVMNMFPFDHGVVGGEATASSGAVEENKVQVMGVQWPVGGDANLSMDSGVKDYYWNGVGSSNWHGIINSSLM